MALTPKDPRQETAPAPRARPDPRSYWRLVRTHRYSLLFALPLLLLYEALAAFRSGDLTGGVRNGADVILKQAVMLLAGEHGPLLVGTILIGGSVFLIGRDMRRSRDNLKARVFAGMAAESVVLALLFGIVVSLVTATVLETLPAFSARLAMAQVAKLDKATELTISLGAGLYEELVFRVMLTPAIAFGARVVLGMRLVTAGVVAAILSALVFSAFHYVGAYGDPLELSSFMFRFIAGLFFSGLYLTRGFGITAWTHALYDVFLISLR